MTASAILARPLNLCREFVQLWRQRHQLIFLLASREITDRFAGSFIGAVWAVTHPLVLMFIYVFVFSVLFQMRFAAGASVRGYDFATFFIAGYLPWMTIQDAMLRSCSTITGSQNLVKQVVFPLEVLPLRSVLASALPQVIGLAFLFVYIPYQTGTLPATVALLPLALAVQFIGLIGVSFFLAAVTVYVRDTREVLTVLVTLGLYLLPIIYMPSSLPEGFRFFLNFNPLSHLIWMYHDIFFYGSVTQPLSWAISAALAIVLFLLGYGVFRSLKHSFGNSL
jgi:lipopolysaccharide transport system permease protein